ncbi:MAG: tetratricopeptide repeat protein [Phycisphaerae bacterium]|nr:tetratricopeptide repeat protein [Phycisphaerae bacterium]
MNKHICTAALAAAAFLALLPGCTTYDDKKHAARTKWDKVSAQARVTVARDLFENGRYEDAQTTAQQCLQSDPELPEAHLILGKCQYLNGQFVQAQSAFIKAVGFDEDLDQAWYWLGEIAAQNRQPAQALEYYSRAVNLQPMHIDYIISVVETYAELGRYDDALGLLEAKQAVLPGNVRLKVTTADMLQRLGKARQAISMYQQALMLQPDNTAVAEALGYCYLTEQDYNRAAAMFEKVAAVAVGEKKAVCLQLLALCSMNAGQYGRAVGYYDKLSVDQRDDEQLWLQMGHAALGAGAANRAAACAARALTLRPGWEDAIALQGCAQYLSNDYDAAIQTFGRIIADKKMGGFAWLMSGRCYQQLGQHDLADRAYENASRLNPESKLTSLLARNR